jgi:hypothetical protein
MLELVQLQSPQNRRVFIEALSDQSERRVLISFQIDGNSISQTFLAFSHIQSEFFGIVLGRNGHNPVLLLVPHSPVLQVLALVERKQQKLLILRRSIAERQLSFAGEVLAEMEVLVGQVVPDGDGLVEVDGFLFRP